MRRETVDAAIANGHATCAPIDAFDVRRSVPLYDDLLQHPLDYCSLVIVRDAQARRLAATYVPVRATVTASTSTVMWLAAPSSILLRNFSSRTWQADHAIVSAPPCLRGTVDFVRLSLIALLLDPAAETEITLPPVLSLLVPGAVWTR